MKKSLNYEGLPIVDIPAKGTGYYIPCLVQDCKGVYSQKAIMTELKSLAEDGIAHIEGVGAFFAATAVAPAPQAQGHV